MPCQSCQKAVNQHPLAKRAWTMGRIPSTLQKEANECTKPMKFDDVYDNRKLTDLPLEVKDSLNGGNGSTERVRRALRSHGVSVSRQIVVTQQEEGDWLIYDKKKNESFVAKEKRGQIGIYRNQHVENRIVDAGLCVRCGACEPACPVDIIRFDERAFPYITEEQKCITTCIRCLKVCPGEIFDFNGMDDEMFGMKPHPESITGIVRRSMVSFALDESVRAKGASGGFVTQLLIYMLDQKMIDGALVLGHTSENGYEITPFIARTREDLKKAQASKYVVAPHLKALKEIEEVEGRYAVVALPCHIHAIKRYQKVSKNLRERIKVLIGLYCSVAFDPVLIDDIIEKGKTTREEVVDVRFRAGTWPGGIEVELRDGSVRTPLKFEAMPDYFNTFKLFYTAPRCYMCIDYSAEYADISVGDPWLRGEDGKLLFEDGRTTVLTRTEIGDRLIDDAVRDGYINVKEIPLETYMVNFEKNAKSKREFVPKNIRMRRLLGLRAPRYSRPLSRRGLLTYIPLAIKISLLELSVRHKWVRRLGIYLSQTWLAVQIYKLNQYRKVRNYAVGYRRMQKFVERVRPDRNERPESIAQKADPVEKGPIGRSAR